MKRIPASLQSPSMIVAMIALIVALGGTAVAAKSLVDGNKLIKKRSLSGSRLKANTLTGTEIRESKLGKVPTAAKADSATKATAADTATKATTADAATNATHATNADTATNATNLGGQAASAYQRRTSQGNALAGVRVSGAGAVGEFFNAFGGAPTVTHDSTGVYYLSFPGIAFTKANSIVTATPSATLSSLCTGVEVDYASGPSGPVITVITNDCSPVALANRGFNLIVHGTSTT